MEIIDIHAHVYEKVAGITQGAPMTSEKLGKSTDRQSDISIFAACI